ncbi:ead/Ea22-like family protein [Enterobacter cloacae complex sp. I2]|uniref:ead/Ea22-like family protein n=1 Tax=Enterobacter cloacae complex sp. I2 TaxID=2779603 RepID=UPI001868BA53|nr:ead/Ea22-like family protein [Enterobacter cloacae complex sp. I2]MBE3510859.1 ead/Ea22-like family protein [Enterobacter cloacae complex sp. I2]
MSNIDKQSLRTAAENATPGEWCTDDYHGVIADAGLNANYYIASCSGPDNRSNKRFIAAASPATVLALLNELEAAEKRIAELEARMVKLPERYEVDMCPTPSPNGEWFSREDVLAALVSADVSYASGNGKGE